MSEQEEVREDVPRPEDERWEMEDPSDADAYGPREDEPNETQQAIDEAGPSNRPVDVRWEGDGPA
jgi:hypothetical protein